MNTEAAIAIGLVCTVLGFLVLFLLVRYAVQVGVTSALRTHEAWMHDGSREKYFDQHAARMAEQEERRRLGY